MNITPITRRLVSLDVSAFDRDGNAAIIGGIDVAVLPKHISPTGSTVWTPVPYVAPTASFLIVGHEADPTGGIVVPYGGGVLWALVRDTPEVDAFEVETITVS